MNKWHAVLGVLLVLAGVGVFQQWSKARAWEQRAAAAEQFVKQDSLVVDSLKRAAVAQAVTAEKADTARQQAIAALPALTALVLPTDTNCIKNLQARDAIIANDTKEIAQWKGAYATEMLAATRLTIERDSLNDVVKSRPKTAGLTIDLLHPRIQISAVYMVYPETRAGIAVSVPLVSFPIHIH